MAASTNSALIPVPGQKRRRSQIPAEPTYVALGMDHIPAAASVLPAPTICNHCRAMKFAHEPPTFCCHNGQVQVATNETPQELVALFTGDDDHSQNFQKYARLYNNFFAFSSLGGRFKKVKAKGIYTLSLHGQIYHFLPHLLPDGADGPRFLQRCLYDSAASEHDTRMGCFEKLRPDVLATLMTVMNRNPYALFFRSLRQVPVTDDLKILVYRNPVLDQRLYNAPTSDEVATVFVEDANCQQVHSCRHILVYGRSNEAHRVKHYYGCYHPLQYPLLCPKGESGWHQGLKRVGCRRGHLHANITFPTSTSLIPNASRLLPREEEASRTRLPKEDKQVSCREYYAYKLQIRPNNFLLNSGRILLQYILDMYVKIENTRLDFLHTNQKRIRSELYQGVVDSVNYGVRSAASVGRTILPPSFIGGPRDMRRRYLNAMALVKKYGKPDLFITITCNPNWPEIKERLQPGESTDNRPDLVARVFRAKLVLLKKLIMDKHIFGRVAARVEVIEFQKRGLPHAHILVFLAEKKILKPEDFDEYVCAELPSNEQPYLQRLVIQHMLHGPFGTLDPKKRLHNEPEQRAAYDCIMSHVRENKPDAFFVDGPGGTGKTFVYCTLYAETRALGKIVLSTATSGIATSNIPTGRTAHSRFKIPINKIGSSTYNVSKQSSLAHLLREASLIIWDEASMAKKEDIEALNLLLQDICDNEDLLFGGKVVVFGGDFRQVLPHKTQNEAIDASLVSSSLWPFLTKFKLSQNIRASEDPLFHNFCWNSEMKHYREKKRLMLGPESTSPFSG